MRISFFLFRQLFPASKGRIDSVTVVREILSKKFMLISKDRGDCNFISLRFGKKLSLMAKIFLICLEVDHWLLWKGFSSFLLTFSEFKQTFIAYHVFIRQLVIACTSSLFYHMHFLLSHLIPWSAPYTRALPITSLKHCLPLHHTLLPLPQYIAVLLIFSIPDDAVDRQRVRDFFLFRFLIQPQASLEAVLHFQNATTGQRETVKVNRISSFKSSHFGELTETFVGLNAKVDKITTTGLWTAIIDTF